MGLIYLSRLVSELIFALEVLMGSGHTQPLWVSLEQNVLMLSYAGVPVMVSIAVLR